MRYDAVNAMLLNEFLKEHKKVEEQQANIAELKSRSRGTEGMSHRSAQKAECEVLNGAVPNWNEQAAQNRKR